jgi:16S rRNA (guanine527-N7)-methyltransferase
MSAESRTAARACRLVFEELLDAEPQLGVRLQAVSLGSLERYVALLLEANRWVNLTRVVEPSAVARLHLLDSLAALPLLDDLRAETIVDIGSGGGLPALPLAIARPHTRWTLVEAVGKKAGLLAAFSQELGLPNVTVVAERAETLGRQPSGRESHDLATARACAPLPVLTELSLPLVRTGGALLAWKGPLSSASSELRAGQLAARQLGGGEPSVHDSGWQALGGHRFVLVPKVAATPPRFPRRPGEPGRRPLA